MARILIIDDHKDILEELDKALKHRGHIPIVANSFIEGKQVLEDKKNPVDLAIIDVRLVDIPRDKSGLDLARISPAIPKIIITGYPTVQITREALKSNDGTPLAVDFIPKGIGSTTKILSSVESILPPPSADAIRNSMTRNWSIIKWLLMTIIVILMYPMILSFNGPSTDQGYIVLTIILAGLALVLQVISLQQNN